MQTCADLDFFLQGMGSRERSLVKYYSCKIRANDWSLFILPVPSRCNYGYSNSNDTEAKPGQIFRTVLGLAIISKKGWLSKLGKLTTKWPQKNWFWKYPPWKLRVFSWKSRVGSWHFLLGRKAYVSGLLLRVSGYCFRSAYHQWNSGRFTRFVMYPPWNILKLTACTWKWMLGIRSFPFGMAYFQGRHVSFREGNGFLQECAQLLKEAEDGRCFDEVRRLDGEARRLWWWME